MPQKAKLRVAQNIAINIDKSVKSKVF
jgi:hypothetical protein